MARIHHIKKLFVREEKSLRQPYVTLIIRVVQSLSGLIFFSSMEENQMKLNTQRSNRKNKGRLISMLNVIVWSRD